MRHCVVLMQTGVIRSRAMRGRVSSWSPHRRGDFNAGDAAAHEPVPVQDRDGPASGLSGRADSAGVPAKTGTALRLCGSSRWRSNSSPRRRGERVVQPGVEQISRLPPHTEVDATTAGADRQSPTHRQRRSRAPQRDLIKMNAPPGEPTASTPRSGT